MSFDPDRVETITFDSFSTLVDPRSATTALEGRVEDPDPIVRRWHPLAVRYATVTNSLDAYRTYEELHRDALGYLLAERGVDVSDERIEEITAVYHDLDPFEDVRGGLQRLADGGYDLAILSNGEPDLLNSLLASADIADLIDETVSADEIRTFKPAAALYEHAAERTGTPVESIAHVAAGWMDVMGSMHAGMDGVWIDRNDTPWPTFDGRPDLRVESLSEFADALSA